MKRYRLTYPVQLKSSDGFCTTPFEIMQQLDKARDTAESGLYEFLRAEKLEDQVQSITSVPHVPGLVITCSDDVAQRLKGQSFVDTIEEDQGRPMPAEARPPRKFKFPER